MFIGGPALDPVPPVKRVTMCKATRGLELASPEQLDREQVVDWMRQSTAVPGVVAHERRDDGAFGLYAGAVRFTVGDEEVLVGAGQLLVAPALAPHRLLTLGGYQAHHIHANDARDAGRVGIAKARLSEFNRGA